MSAEADEIRASIRELEEKADHLEEAERERQESALMRRDQADAAEFRAVLLDLSRIGVMTFNDVLNQDTSAREGAALVALKACLEWIEEATREGWS